MACLPDGFKAMVPAILILVFAWTLKSMTDSLGAAEYVAGIVAGSAEGMVNLLPAIQFKSILINQCLNVLDDLIHVQRHLSRQSQNDILCCCQYIN